ncbi:unnamed protein product [Euphydryas editha]|uniref:ATP-dependent DNA helicase n=1 Tax=Euphydryas editha TaxID=104508 RepID=A0AAU9TQF8_EUPED|nr:unnamed protein product [Euphydryas editha]
MARHVVADKNIQQYLEQGDSSCSEIEDFKEFSEQDTDSVQEGELFHEHLPEAACATVPPFSVTIPDLTIPEYLEDVPVSTLQCGYYLGKDSTTQWKVNEPTQRVRIRSYNIVLEAAGPNGDTKQCEFWRTPDSTIPFRRLQFPIRLAFAMSMNKSQGQTMSICGLDLENPDGVILTTRPSALD